MNKLLLKKNRDTIKFMAFQVMIDNGYLYDSDRNFSIIEKSYNMIYGSYKNGIPEYRLPYLNEDFIKKNYIL
jgi:hypothetical protein